MTAPMPRVMNAIGLLPNVVPPGAVYIGGSSQNGWRRSIWANRFLMDRPGQKRDGTRAEVIEKYRRWLCDAPEAAKLRADLHQLRGHDLVCWCAPRRCHGDVLLALANDLPLRP